MVFPVVPIAFPRGPPASGESAVHVAREEIALLRSSGVSAVDGQNRPGDGVEEHPIEAGRVSGENLRRLRVDGADSVELRPTGGGAREGGRGDGELHLRPDRPQSAFDRGAGGVDRRRGGEKHVHQHIGADLIDAALVDPDVSTGAVGRAGAAGCVVAGGGRGRGGTGGDGALRRWVNGAASGAIRISDRARLARQTIMDAVDLGRGPDRPEHRHPVAEVFDPHPPCERRRVVALLDRLRVVLLGDLLGIRPGARCGGGLGVGEHVALVCGAGLGVLEPRALVDDRGQDQAKR